MGPFGSVAEEQLKLAGQLADAYRPQPVFCPSFDDVLKFIDGLKARGVLSFSGMGINVQLQWDNGIPTAPSVSQTNEVVDVGGGLMMPKADATDLFGHEKP